MYTTAEILDGAIQDRTADQFLGVIDGTMTRVMDVSDTDILYSQITHPPTMTMIEEVSFDEESLYWTFKYESMKSDPDGDSINNFYRVLYFSKVNTDYEKGDADNECLCDRQSVDCTIDACLQNMKDNYIVNSDLPSPSQQLTGDFVTFSDTSSTNPPEILVKDFPGTAVQNITIKLHTSYIKNTLGIQKTVTLTGTSEDLYTATRFGIGMLFISKSLSEGVPAAANSIIMFDQFDIVEDSFAHAALSISNSYSLARHVQFYISRVDKTNVGLAHIEYYLDPSYNFLDFRASVNENLIGDDICESTKVEMRQLDCYVKETADSLCVADFKNNIISVTIPIPSTTIEQSEPIQIQTTIKSEKTGSTEELPILSLLNFMSNGHVNTVCKDAFQETFSPIDYVELKIFKQGLGEVLEEVESASDYNAGSSMSTVQSLVTLVLQPRDNTAAKTHFDTSSDTIQLDEIYMVHKLQEGIFPEQEVRGVMDANLRMRLQIPDNFYSQCPLETTAFVQTTEQKCVTTKDYDNKPLQRPITKGTYVYEIQYSTDILLDVAIDDLDITLNPHFNFTVRVPDTYSIELWEDGARLEGDHTQNTSYVTFTPKTDPLQTIKIKSTEDDTFTEVERNIALSESIPDYTNDLAFLRKVFGTTNEDEIHTFLEAVYGLPINSPHKAKRYGAWPVYAWPQNPIGLVDKTRIYMSWSVASPSVGRRLLQTTHPKPKRRRARPFEHRLREALTNLKVLPKLPRIKKTYSKQ